MVNVVFNTAFVGDLLLSIPLLKQIKREWPRTPLVLITRPGLATFFRENKLADEVIEFDKKKSESLNNFNKKIMSYEIDKLFCAHMSFRSAWLLRNVKAKNKISYKQWWNSRFFDTLVERPMDLPEAPRVLALLAPFDEPIKKQIDEFIVDRKYHNTKRRDVFGKWSHTIGANLSLKVEASNDFVNQTLFKLKIQKPFVVLAPSSQWATKRWTNDGFIELMQKLTQRDLNIYLVGTAGEKNHCVELQNRAAAQVKSKYEIRSIAGETNLHELHAIMSAANFIVANDSGPMHMATAAGVPVVGIFGPTTLELGYRPWSDQSYVVQVDLKCRPCGKHGHNKCPIGTHDCMKKITAADVLRGVDSIIK